MVRKKFSKKQRSEIRHKYGKKGNKKNVYGFRRLQVLFFRLKGMKNKDIAEFTGFSVQYITDLVRVYFEKGMDAILIDNRTTNNRRMSFEEESEFLEQFREVAEAGQIITVDNILQKFEEKTNKKSNTSTIYNLLKRHGWRKVKPRPRHPGAANEEEKNSSKKLTQIGSKSCWKNMTQTTMQDMRK